MTTFTTGGSAVVFNTSGTAVTFTVTPNPTSFTVGVAGPAGATGATGATGAAGATGATGPAGTGVPTGGTANQVLAKIDSTDYNTQWVDQTGGSGGTSLPDQTGNAGAALTTDGTVASWAWGIQNGDYGLLAYESGVLLDHQGGVGYSAIEILASGTAQMVADDDVEMAKVVVGRSGTVTIDGSAAVLINAVPIDLTGASTSDVLTFDGTGFAPAAPSGGGSGLGTVVANGDAAGTTNAGGTIALTLANTAVTPGYYGGAATVGAFGVDSKGRITYAAGSAISIAPAQVQGTAVLQTLADAKGDIIAATGADAWARLAVGGTAGHVLTVDAAESTGMKWAAAAGGASGIPETLIDAKGDLILGTAADTAARLAVGTVEGQVLTVGTAYPLGVGWVAPSAAAPGLVLVATSSFSAASSVSVDGCFTSSYTNYRVLVVTSVSTPAQMTMKLRASSTDTSTGYNYQNFQFDGGTPNYARFTAQTSAELAYLHTTQKNYVDITVVNPALAETTLMRSTGYSSLSEAFIKDAAANQTSATAFDGFSVIPSAGTITGSLAVYGYRKAL